METQVAAPRQPALRALGLRKRFGSTEALRGLDLRVDAGEVVGLLGPNGAGKTTALRCVAGVLRPDDGDVRITGAPGGSRAAQAAVSLLPETPDLYGSLTVGEHVRFVAAAYDLPGGPQGGWELRAAALLRRFGLEGLTDRLPVDLSQGQRRKTALVLALLHGARVLLLDEPFNALDPQAVSELRALLQDLAAEGTAVLVSSHGLAEAQRLCDRVVVLAGGRCVADGDLDDLRHAAGTGADADLETVFLRLTAEVGDDER